MSKVMVIGAGPAGIMAAITAAENHNVVLVDGNEKIAKKLSNPMILTSYPLSSFR